MERPNRDRKSTIRLSPETYDELESIKRHFGSRAHVSYDTSVALVVQDHRSYHAYKIPFKANIGIAKQAAGRESTMGEMVAFLLEFYKENSI